MGHTKVMLDDLDLNSLAASLDHLTQCFRENEAGASKLAIGLSVIIATSKVLAKGDAMIKNAKDWGNTRAIYPHELRTAQDRIKELEQQLAAGQSHAPDPDMASDLLQCRSLTAAWKRRAEVAEAELGALRSRQAEPQPAPDAPQPSARPKRDRTEYMREFMRKKRAASRFENINLRTYDVTS